MIYINTTGHGEPPPPEKQSVPVKKPLPEDTEE